MSEGPDARRDVPLDGNVNVERGAATAVLRNFSFRNLLFAAATSSIGDWIGLFALIALAETLAGTTRSGALAVSFVMIARVVPTLFIAPVAGVFVDRWDRKRTMIVTDIIRGVVMLGVAFVGDAFQLIIATFVIEVAAALFIPAKDATVPTIVSPRRLVQANQLSLFSTYATLPIGALLAAVVISITERVAGAASMVARFPDVMAFLAERPEAVPIILNALSFFGSIWFIRRMDVPDDHLRAHEQRTEEEGPTNALTEFREGLRFIADKPLIRALVVGIMTAFLAAGAVIGVGEFFATIVNAGDAGFATLGFVVGLGLAVGIVGAGPLSRRIAKERLFAPGVFVAGVSLVVAALMPNLLLASIPALVMGIGSGVAFILGYTMLQEYSEDEIRGRVFATFNTAVRMSLFVSLVAGPATVFVLGPELTAAQIRAGATSQGVDELEELDTDATYPYQIGGIRATLILAGMTGAAGAVWTGWSIARVLRRREEEGTGAPTTAATDDVAAGGTHGVFIVFEGGEGAGKSTQIDLLRREVEGVGRAVVVTREPGGTPTGEAVRDILLDADGQVGPRAEALLYAAARAEHAAEVLAPALDRGEVVLCDRYVDSSIVYQGVGRDLGVEVVAQVNAWATDRLQPDLTVLLDVPAEVGLARAREVESPDRLEAAGLEFHERVNEAFRDRARRAPDRYLVVDATAAVEAVHAEIRAEVMALLGVDVDGDDGPGASDRDADAAAAGDAAGDEATQARALDGAAPRFTEPLFGDSPVMARAPARPGSDADEVGSTDDASAAAAGADDVDDGEGFDSPPWTDDVNDPAPPPSGDVRREQRQAVPAWLALPGEDGDVDRPTS